jgi:hypothetical protein
MLLRRGELAFIGDTALGIEAYASENINRQSGNQAVCHIWEKGLQIHDIRIEPSCVRCGDTATAIVKYTAIQNRALRYLRCNFTNESRQLLADYDSSIYNRQFELLKGTHELRIPLGPIPLSRGKYLFNIAAFDETRKVTLFHAIDQQCLEVKSTMVTTSIMEMGHGT